MNDRTQVYLLFGFSAAGKTTLGQHLAEFLKYRWIELDVPNQNTEQALRNVDPVLGQTWRDFRDRCDATGLRDGLLKQVAQHSSLGVVAGFQSDVVLTPSQCRCLQEAHVGCSILVGDRTRLLEAFLAREQQTGRRLPAAHWQRHNMGQIDAMNGRACREFEVDVFDRNGERKLLTDLTAEIVNHQVLDGRVPT